VQTYEDVAVRQEMRELGPTSGERAALRSFRRAALTCRGYRAHLERLGIDHRTVMRLSEVPYTDKRSVFGDVLDLWIEGGRVSDAAELLTSSGQSGLFSVGVTSRSERRAQERAIDLSLRAIGASEQSSTLLLNCLPMGITVPSRLATVATPSVHVEMAVEILARTGPGFDRVVIVAEPLFLKEMGEAGLREHGAGFAERVAACVVGGEWIAESWRRYVSELFGFAAPSQHRPGVMVSMGAAELGLHALQETGPLRAARMLLDGPLSRLAVFGRDPGYSPTFLTWDPNRLYLEERAHADGATTLVLTSLTRRLLPLVRYDLDDEVDILDAEVANRELDRIGSDLRIEGPVLAIWGRRGTAIRGPGWSLRPEQIKEGLFATAAHAGSLTGRFFLAVEGEQPVLHVQLRQGVGAAPGLERALESIAAGAASVPARGRVHSYREYPFHDAGDFQHKPRYLERTP
jgi:phenylacetate-CoA ligase